MQSHAMKLWYDICSEKYLGEMPRLAGGKLISGIDWLHGEHDVWSAGGGDGTLGGEVRSETLRSC
jgi:hypothetical protein